jgi:hypothetical protein
MNKLRYKLSYGELFTYCENGIRLDQEIAWAISRNIKPTDLRIEVVGKAWHEPDSTKQQKSGDS